VQDSETLRVTTEDVGRSLVTQHRDIFRATDAELYKSLPPDLEKILVIDEWYHRDYFQMAAPELTAEEREDIQSASLARNKSVRLCADGSSRYFERIVATMSETNRFAKLR
jgi:hypothetical protein